jgi:hypothetical protein
MAQSVAWTLLGVFSATLSEQFAELTGKPFRQIQTLFISIFTSLFLSCRFYI